MNGDSLLKYHCYLFMKLFFSRVILEKFNRGSNEELHMGETTK